jgi:hypothetical protein
MTLRRHHNDVKLSVIDLHMTCRPQLCYCAIWRVEDEVRFAKNRMCAAFELRCFFHVREKIFWKKWETIEVWYLIDLSEGGTCTSTSTRANTISDSLLDVHYYICIGS